MPDRPGTDENGSTGEDLRVAARKAATAVAVGAGLAAVRALRARSSADEEIPLDRDDDDQVEQDDPVERDVAPPPPPREPEPRPRAEERPVAGADLDEVKRVVAAGREQLEALQARPVELVSGVERTSSGWTVTLELVELSRIPESTDVLASYEVILDDSRNLVRYSRLRRYNRSQADMDGA